MLDFLQEKEINEAFSDELWLKLSPEIIAVAWSETRKFSGEVSRWNAYLNSLCLKCLVPWLEAEREAEIIVPPEAELASIWEVVNGTPITVDNNSVVVVPVEAIALEEFRVPQEWVDIPQWVANYYLAVEINADDGWLKVCGYATHEMLKTQGVYDQSDRSYSLDKADLVENLDVMWVAMELCPDEKLPVASLPALGANRVENLLTKLSQNFGHSPRLEVGFPYWGALLENPVWRQELYRRRSAGVVSRALTSLSNWYKDAIEPGWQTMEELAAGAASPAVFAFRNRLLEKREPEAIARLINLIYHSSDEGRLKVAAQRLVDIKLEAEQRSEVVGALIHLLGKTDNEETRWNAAETLWAIAPDNPVSGIRRIKDLGMQISGHSLSLMVAILPKPEQKFAVLVRLYSLSDACLPPGLKLTVIDEDGEEFLDAKARETDNFIQLKFTGDSGESFSVKIALANSEITEGFAI
jgi:hypothetical protein